MLFPKEFEEKIGFDHVRSLLRKECLSPQGKELVDQIDFSEDETTIRIRSGRVAEFMTILSEGLNPPLPDEPDLRDEIQRLRAEGAYLMPEELLSLKVSMAAVKEWLKALASNAFSRFRLITDLAAHLEDPGWIIDGVERILDGKGSVRDHASPALAEIRQSIKQKTSANERTIGKILAQARTSGWTASDAEITVRDGRLVLPMMAAHKKKVRGVVHDESATGQTVYLEPESCFEINNEIKELEGAERREIIRILRHFANTLRPHLESLDEAYSFLGQIDFIRAKARFSVDTGAVVPVISSRPVINWKQAVHPLLLLSHRQKGKEVVPLDINLDEDQRILIISGPNAGGKSICLKTIGLLQYMHQSGLPVPMLPDSELGTFRNIMIDIGDQQSLEQDLSTYSSHLINIDHFLRHADAGTLFLIDEFGSGTDPSLGGAIAEASLVFLNDLKAFGVVTTHYSNLKLLAGRLPGIVNGAMLFDTVSMQPMYRLVVGKPGSSFTFEIAEKTGLLKEVISQAMDLAGREHVDFDRKLQELEAEKLFVEKQKQEFEVAEQFLAEVIGKYEKMKSDLEAKKAQVMEKAREEARQLLADANKLIEKTVRDIKSVSAEKNSTSEIRHEFERKKTKMTEGPAVKDTPESHELKLQIKTGDWVRIKGQERAGKVMRIKADDVIVDYEGIHFTVASSKIEPAEKPDDPGRPVRSSISMPGDITLRAANFRLTLDLRGKKAEEALAVVRKYLDDALLVGIGEVSILHGKGDGILRMAIRRMLAESENVASYEDEHAERGGSGITKVRLK